MLRRRSALAGTLCLLAGARARAENITFFRILTGATGGTYYPVGGLLATAISNPPGSLDCEMGGSCGASDLVASAVASNGSIGNIEDLGANRMQSALVQSDIAYWAYTGSGLFQGRPKSLALRAIARLYPESIQIVASKRSGITSIAGLRGRRVSLDEENSGTQADARLVLGAYGLNESNIQASFVPAQRVEYSFRDGSIDVFFSVSGWPDETITRLATSVGVVLVPIAGPAADRLISRYRFMETGRIPDDAYPGVRGVPTVNVNALWLTTTYQPDDLIYRITKALWSPSARHLLDTGHIMGRQIRLETALNGLPVPLHPGAARFYKEQRLIK